MFNIDVNQPNWIQSRVCTFSLILAIPMLNACYPVGCGLQYVLSTVPLTCNLLRRVVVRYPHHTWLLRIFQESWKMGKNRKWIKQTVLLSRYTEYHGYCISYIDLPGYTSSWNVNKSWLLRYEKGSVID